MEIKLNNIIDNKATIKDALRLIDLSGESGYTLFVIDETNKLVGTVTDGDIRRILLKGYIIGDSILVCTNTNYKKVLKNDDLSSKFRELKKDKIRFLPVVDENNYLTSILDLQYYIGFIPVDAVLMAGGRGQRLLPLTSAVPKPMLIIGDKPIIEHNIDRLIKFGVQNFYISVNYLKEKIEDYFDNGNKKNINITYIKEDMPMGTFGAVTLVKDFEKDCILLMNSDLLTDINFDDFFNTFIKSKADMAVAAVSFKSEVPYAVLETTETNQVISFKEKPKYSYLSNAGIYLFKKDLLKYIPKGIFYNTTDFMDLIIEKEFKLIAYPILGYWLDIGRMDDYLKAKEDILHLNF
jgi:dTDP-glucose pyrophosphorylase